MSIDLNRLAGFFPAADLEWKPITVSKKTGKALAAPYLTNRAIMDRLDDVCGPGKWRNEFSAGPSGGVLCGISIRIDFGDGSSPQWVTKWDGAENTDVEAVKGGLSSAMRRAAVQWGIGRYLYQVPNQWVPVNERGYFSQPPSMPAAFLPDRSHAATAPAALADASPDASPDAPRRRAGERRIVTGRVDDSYLFRG